MAAKPRDIDAYLAGLPVAQKAALQRLRRMIRDIVPDAEECISYRLPSFRLDGRLLVCFGARANHCAFYPMSSATVRDHQALLRKYDTSQGTIRFQPSKPLPISLVRKLVKARMAENARPKP